jgi:hypothetical protein
MIDTKIMIDRWVHLLADLIKTVETVKTPGLGRTFRRLVMGMVDQIVETTKDVMVDCQRMTSHQMSGETDVLDEIRVRYRSSIGWLCETM